MAYTFRKARLPPHQRACYRCKIEPGNGRKMFMASKLKLCDYCGRIILKCIQTKLDEIELEEMKSNEDDLS